MVTNNKREAIIASFSLTLTIALYLMLGDKLAHRIYDSYFFPHPRPFIEGIIYTAALIIVGYSAVLYHVCLIGNYIRRARHKPVSLDTIAAELYDAPAPSLAVLVPAYKEERSVMWQTMLSAALSAYPSKRVVLLVDDPFNPKSAEDKLALATARQLPHDMQQQFDAQLARHRDGQGAYLARKQLGNFDAVQECHHLAEAYDSVVAFLEEQMELAAEGVPFEQLNFGNKFFIERMLKEPAAMYDARAHALRMAAAHHPLSQEEITRHYAQLVGLFNVQFSSFERKKYVNLSHDANKAMNLNSYMMLVGKSWQEVTTAKGLQLRECAPEDATFTIPPADFINTIDADSLMTHDYVARLIHFMQQPENSRVAVAQSPCSAIPGSTVPVERVASACIDVQFHTHQGYTFWDASFWVGANAMLRYTALEAIKEIQEVDGKTVAIYIQDRTVIEDTESTIDLVHKGWKLYNHPERMTYSTTPCDFGSLLIQRRRWSNGGLIILPKLFRYAWHAKWDLRLVKELFMRVNYLALTTLGCAVTIMLVFHTFSPRLSSPMVVYANLPLLVLYSRDLKLCGHRALDTLRVCSLNLMLFPIILAGVLKQFQQMVTGKKIPFGRTPKVASRTSAPAMYYLAEIAIVGYYAATLINDYQDGRWAQMGYAFVNTCFFGYALVYFIGIRPMMEDLAHSFRRTFLRQKAPVVAAPVAAAISNA